MKKDRNYGIDLLKMLSMFMVVLLHILDYSKIREQGMINNTAVYGGAWLLEICAYCAVNIFSMTTGYLMSSRPFGYKKILPLWAQGFFYSAAGAMILFPIFPQSFGLKTVLNSLFYVSTGSYWYFTAYFCMFLFMPFLNRLTDGLSKKRFSVLLATCFFLFSFFPTVFCRDIFHTNSGYSALWLCVMYLFGSYIKRFNVAEKIKPYVSVLLYAYSVLFTWGVKMCAEAILPQNAHKEAIANIFFKYTSFTIVIAAFALFTLFSKIKVSKKGLLLSIAKLSPYSFGVYLIHMHPLFKTNVLSNYGVLFQELPPLLIIPAILVFSFLLFAVCIGIEYLRSLIFKKLKINDCIYKAASFTASKFLGSNLGIKLEKMLSDDKETANSTDCKKTVSDTSN